MNGICLICGKKLNNTFVCECGYDETKYYDRYRTLGILETSTMSSYQQRNIFIRELINSEIEKLDIGALRIADEAVAEELVSTEVQTGSKFAFGNDLETSKTFQWTVITRTGNRILLLCDDFVSQQEYGGTSWEVSGIRKWLNGDFVMSLPNAVQGMILTTRIENKNNTQFYTQAGNDTLDRLFLLSEEELEKYVADKEQRIVSNSGKNNGMWWLRTPGFTTDSAIVVDKYGNVRINGVAKSTKVIHVRPAMWLDLARGK